MTKPTNQKISQCLLQSGNQKMEAWLDASKIKVGYSVTLKDSDDPERLWKIIHISQPMDKNLIRTAHESNAIHEKDFHGKLKGLNL